MVFIEVSNYVLPFIAIPYIIRVIGTEKYGLIMFVYAIITYFTIMVEYSFDAIATRYISIHRKNLLRISVYFWNVLFVQFCLLVASFLIFMLLIYSIDAFYVEKQIFFLSFGIVVGTLLFPKWFFQGIEEMKYISILRFLSELLYLILVLSFIHEENEYWLVPMFLSISTIIAGMISIIYIKTVFKVHTIAPSFRLAKHVLKSGGHLFVSSIAVNLYSSTNTVILGFLTNYTVVGLYSMAYTIFSAISKVVKVYVTAVYPHIARLSLNADKMITETKIFLKLYIAALVVLSVLLIFMAPYGIELLYGKGHDDSVWILRLLAISLLVEPMGRFFTVYLVLKRKQKLISKITFLTMLFNFITVFPMIFFFQGAGMAMTKIMVESFQVILNVRYNVELFRKIRP